MDEKKILKAFSNWVDDQFDFKKIVGGLAGTGIEAVDGFVFSVTVKAAYHKVPEEHKEEVLQVFQAMVDKDYETIEQVSVEKVVEILKSPLGDEKERIIVGGVIDIVFDLLQVPE